MVRSFLACLLIFSAFVTSATSGLPPVTEQEKAQIMPVVYARIKHLYPHRTISGFTRRRDGAVEVLMSLGDIYIMRKSGSAWKIVEETAITY